MRRKGMIRMGWVKLQKGVRHRSKLMRKNKGRKYLFPMKYTII